MDEPRVKIVAIGDGGVGKTCLYISYATGAFPRDYVPTVFESYSVDQAVAGKQVMLHLWDTAGPEEYDRLRPLSYPGSDVCLVCFSCTSQDSYEAVIDKWVPEFQHYCPGVPIILCCNKIDLRDDPEVKVRFQPLTTVQGIELARKVGATAYVECSALTQKGLDNVFDIASKLGLGMLRGKTKIPERKVQEIAPSVLQRGLKALGFKIGSSQKKVVPVLHGVHNVILQRKDLSLSVPVLGHTATAVFDNIVVVGGVNEMGEHNKHVFDFKTNNDTWTLIEGVEIPPLQFHTTILWNFRLFFFGGNSNAYSNELFVFDIAKKSILKIEPKGTVPSPRYGHSAVLFNDKMYIFGGYDLSAKTCNDMYCFTIATSTWGKVKFHGSVPPSRFMHTAVVRDKSMYVFGGQGDAGVLNDVYQFNFETGMWCKLKPKGTAPEPRCGHSVVASASGMYIHGGCDKSKNLYFADLHCLNFSSIEWFTIRVAGLNPRANHSCVDVNGSLYIIGGQGNSGILSSTFKLYQPKTIEMLPRDIVMQVLMYCDTTDCFHVMTTSKHLRLTCDDEILWRHFCNTLIPYHMDGDIQSYKKYFYEFCVNAPFIVSIPDQNLSNVRSLLKID